MNAIAELLAKRLCGCRHIGRIERIALEVRAAGSVGGPGMRCAVGERCTDCGAWRAPGATAWSLPELARDLSVAIASAEAPIIDLTRDPDQTGARRAARHLDPFEGADHGALDLSRDPIAVSVELTAPSALPWGERRPSSASILVEELADLDKPRTEPPR